MIEWTEQDNIRLNDLTEAFRDSIFTKALAYIYQTTGAEPYGFQEEWRGALRAVAEVARLRNELDDLEDDLFHQGIENSLNT